MIRPFLASLLCVSSSLAWSCSCFGPQTFCASMDTAVAEPDIVVLATKLSDIHYGMQLRVVQVFGGTVGVGDTLMVWGDNGALCRIYAGAWSIGDTGVFALHNTDFAGNWIVNTQYPPNLEQPGDYHISVCGVYALGYSNGLVSGPIDGTNTSMDLNDFSSLVNTCFLSTGIEELPEFEFALYTAGDELIIELPTDRADRYSARLFATDGRCLRAFTLLPGRNTASLIGLSTGVHLLHVSGNTVSATRKVWVP